MLTLLRIPKVAVSMQEGTLVAWLASDGQFVREGEAIYTLELEKSAMDVVAPASGVLKHAKPAGSVCPVGEVVGEIVAEG